MITEDLTVSEVAVETPVTAAASDADTDGDGRVDEITIAIQMTFTVVLNKLTV